MALKNEPEIATHGQAGAESRQHAAGEALQQAALLLRHADAEVAAQQSGDECSAEHPDEEPARAAGKGATRQCRCPGNTASSRRERPSL